MILRGAAHRANAGWEIAPVPYAALCAGTDALVGPHLAAAGGMVTAGKDAVHRKVRSALRELPNAAGKICAFDQSPPSTAPHECD